MYRNRPPENCSEEGRPVHHALFLIKFFNATKYIVQVSHVGLNKKMRTSEH